jgi:uncharacterized BrkB/YihY/UPF0761 family membrane protein
MDAQEKEKKLRLMRFWLFGAFAIFFVAVTVYFGAIAQAVGIAVNDPSVFAVFKNTGYWIFVVVLALLCVGVWYIYKWYIGRQ